MKKMSGRRVLITGETRGIGAAAAERILEEGSRVAVFGRDQAALEETKKGIHDWRQLSKPTSRV